MKDSVTLDATDYVYASANPHKLRENHMCLLTASKAQRLIHYCSTYSDSADGRASVSMPRKKIREQLEIAFLGRVQLDVN